MALFIRRALTPRAIITWSAADWMGSRSLQRHSEINQVFLIIYHEKNSNNIPFLRSPISSFFCCCRLLLVSVFISLSLCIFFFSFGSFFNTTFKFCTSHSPIIYSSSFISLFLSLYISASVLHSSPSVSSFFQFSLFSVHFYLLSINLFSSLFLYFNFICITFFFAFYVSFILSSFIFFRTFIRLLDHKFHSARLFSLFVSIYVSSVP